MEATCALYGLIHARYVLTTAGLEAMYAKYTLQVRRPAERAQRQHLGRISHSFASPANLHVSGCSTSLAQQGPATACRQTTLVGVWVGVRWVGRFHNPSWISRAVGCGQTDMQSVRFH